MAKKVKAFVLSSTILAMLLFSAFGTIIVHADDGSGTEAAGAETTGTSGGGEQPPGDQTDVVNPVGDGTQPRLKHALPPDTSSVPADASVPTDLASDESAPPMEPLLEQVPGNTTVTVLNTSGEAMPLVSQAAADAIASDFDPIWCPAGQTTPTPGTNDCTTAFDSFNDLLSFLQANEMNPTYQQAGTIYIQQGQYQGSESSVDFNNYDFNSLNNYDLTLQGGWATPTDTTSFDIPVIIGSGSNPWIGSLTLNNINISGVADQAGLTLFTQGDITLSNVAVTGSQSGADLNAGGDVSVSDSEFSDNEEQGAKINSGGNVNIAASKFNHNSSGHPTGLGLEVNSGGKVTLASIEANNNQLFGADIKAVSDVLVTDSFFSGNQGSAYVLGSGWKYDGYGLQVSTSGNIKLDGVTADDNYLFGASLTGVTIDVANSSFSANDSHFAEQLLGSGLKVVGTGDVTLASVSANDNQLFGADIQTTGAVTVTDSFFNGNASYNYSSTGDKHYEGYGLKIVTTREVSLVNVEAEENYLYGAHIEGADVAIDTGRFSNNGSGTGLDLTGRGLEIISEFGVALLEVTADNNQKFGADIQAGDAVAIERSSFNGHIAYVYDLNTGKIASRDGGFGLRVVTTGNIALEDVTADNNYLYGAYLQGDDTSVEGNVGISSFSGNGSGVLSQPPGDDFGYGLKIVSTGSVNLANVNSAESVGNQLFGADITAAQSVTIVSSFFSGNQSVTFVPGDDELTFYGYGLTVNTKADIVLTEVVANFNNLWGCKLNGNNVILSDTQCSNNVSDSNIFIDDTGLIINAAGFVDLYNVDASGNRLVGADITAQGLVSIDTSTFTNNQGFTCSLNWCPEGSITYHGYGLKVSTPGLIMVTNTTVSDNNLFGAQLNGGIVSVTDSTFNDNRLGDGLTIDATDNVTLTNVTAVNNGGDGVDVTGVCGKTVQVTGGTFTDNDLYGLKVTSATLNADGTQVFANNGSGNVFTEGGCAIVLTLVAKRAPRTMTSPTTSPDAGSPATTLSGTTGQTTIDRDVVRKYKSAGHLQALARLSMFSGLGYWGTR